MRTVAHNKRMVRLRDFSTAFSRSAFTDVLLFDDFSRFDWLRAQYRLRSKTYAGLIRGAYAAISKDYRCEYVYKNELVNLLLRRYGTRSTVYLVSFGWAVRLLTW